MSPHPSLTRNNVIAAHDLIKPHIHLTPVLTSHTLSDLASHPQSPDSLPEAHGPSPRPARPRMRLFFKCENLQRGGAFKPRGAFHAVARLAPEQRARGVATHSSGNHAQALALAAQAHGVPAAIAMPANSAPGKLAATRGYGARVAPSGPTEPERVAFAEALVMETGATLVPPADHPDVALGQGTAALELEAQVRDLVAADPELSVRGAEGGTLDAVITPLGGGGLLAGTATALAPTGVRVFGAEPSFEGADDGRRGLQVGERVTEVRTRTVADGLRTPVGKVGWSVTTDTSRVQGLFAVSEAQIKAAMRLVMERMKLVVEPSAVVGLAVVLFDEDFRRMVEREGGEEGWDVGVVLSGGNTTVEAICELFGGVKETDGGMPEQHDSLPDTKTDG